MASSILQNWLKVALNLVDLDAKKVPKHRSLFPRVEKCHRIYCRKLLPQAIAASYCRKLLPQAIAASYCRKLLPLFGRLSWSSF
jgi:hypothetical protein